MLHGALMGPHQGAFQHGKSTEHILLIAVGYIANSLHSGRAVSTGSEESL